MSEQEHKDDHGKHITIVVNGRKEEVSKEVLGYDEVVAIAFPTRKPDYEYEVTYHKAFGPKPDGTLSPGKTVHVQDGTIFNVTPTRKS
jgi:hypothetical protein